MSRFRKIAAAATLAVLAGCATLTEDSTDQLLEVHVVQDHRELAGVGCVLSNTLGRWFVVAPGRVRVARHAQPLTIDCGREGVGRAVQLAQSRYDPHDLIGNVLATGGAGYVVDRYTGAGFGYPPVLTMVIPKPPAPDAALAEALPNQVF